MYEISQNLIEINFKPEFDLRQYFDCAQHNRSLFYCFPKTRRRFAGLSVQKATTQYSGNNRNPKESSLNSNL